MRIKLEGDIGAEITNNTFTSLANELQEGEPLEIELSSLGGSFYEGLKIYNTLQELKSRGHNLTCLVNTIVASSATYILMACNTRKIYANSFIYVHCSMLETIESKNAEDLKKSVEALEKYDVSIAGMYAENTETPAEDWLNLMKQETWLSANECKAYGICSEIISNEVEKSGKIWNHIQQKELPAEVLNVLAGKETEKQEQEEELKEEVNEVSPTGDSVEEQAKSEELEEVSPTGDSVEEQTEPDSDTLTELALLRIENNAYRRKNKHEF